MEACPAYPLIIPRERAAYFQRLARDYYDMGLFNHASRTYARARAIMGIE